MNSKKQILIIGAIFIAIISILFFNIRADYKARHNITQKEIDGLKDISKIHKLNITLKNLRGISQLNIDNMKYFQKILNLNNYKIESVIKNLKDTSVQSSYLEFLSNRNNLSKHELFENYTQLIKLLDAKRIDISDTSYLLFEPDREMYFLMLVSVLDVHKITENIGKIRDMGAAILNNPSNLEHKKLFILKNNIHMFLQTIEDIKFTLSKLNPKDSNKLKILLDSIISDFYDMSKVINYIENKNSTITSKDFFSKQSKLLKNVDNLFIISKDTLITKLQQRVEMLSYKLSIGTLLYIILIVIICIVTYANYKDIHKNKLFKKKKEKENDFINLLRKDYSRNLSLKQICDISLNHIIHEFKALNGSLYIFDQDNNKLYLGSVYGIKQGSLEPTLDIHDNNISENILEKRIQIRDINQDINLGNISTTALKLITMPLIEFDKSIGTLQLCFDDKFNDIDIEFLEKITSIMASHIHKALIDDAILKHLKLIDQNILISKTDLDGKIIEVSEELCNLSQYPKEKLIGKNHRILRHKDMPKEIFEDLWGTITRGEIWRGEIKNRKKDGTYYWIDSIISPDFDINGNIIGYTALRHDITDKKKIEEIAITDKLTSLFNRRHFDSLFPQKIEINKRAKGLLAFVIIDIDHFKQYNDTYGHQEGDNTLKMVAAALKKTLHRPDDYTFRLGGEEFGLLYFIQNKEDAIDMANKARVNVENLKIEHSGNSASKYVTISSGLYIISADDNSTADDIYKSADKALYKSKQNGRNQVFAVQ